jgi:hypothetical protein
MVQPASTRVRGAHRPRLPWPTALLIGCSAFEPGPPPVLPDPGGAERGVRLVLEVEIESRQLTGIYDGVLVARTAPAPAVRLQLFPDMGGKVLDVAADPTRIAGLMPLAAIHREWRAGERASPHLLLLLGVSLLENAAPLGRERISAHAPGPPIRVRADGTFPGSAVEAVLDGAGRVVEREMRWGQARWRERWDLDAALLTVEAPRFRLRARVVEREGVADLPGGLFDLEPPAR